jgi:hypothetical protein
MLELLFFVSFSMLSVKKLKQLIQPVHLLLGPVWIGLFFLPVIVNLNLRELFIQCNNLFDSLPINFQYDKTQMNFLKNKYYAGLVKFEA